MRILILFLIVGAVSATAQPTIWGGGKFFSQQGDTLFAPKMSDLKTFALGTYFMKFQGPATSVKTYTLPNVSATILTDFNTVTIGQGGTGVSSTLTGMLLGGSSAFSAITSTTVGQIPRCTGSNTFAFGALDLANSSAVTGALPYGNGGRETTSGRATGQTAANSNVVTATVGGSDASYEVSVNVLITTSGSEIFTVTVDFTDEGNTARTMTLTTAIPAGTLGQNIRFNNGAVPYSGIPTHIRCKASTNIVVKTTGTFTGCTYNVEGYIRRL